MSARLKTHYLVCPVCLAGHKVRATGAYGILVRDKNGHEGVALPCGKHPALEVAEALAKLVERRA
jgi:hypothetical protein